MARRRERPKLIVELHADWRTASRPLRLGVGDGSSRGCRTGPPSMRSGEPTRPGRSRPSRRGLPSTRPGRNRRRPSPPTSTSRASMLKRRRPLPAKPAVAWIGVLETYKDPMTLIEAWRTVAAQVPAASLTVVGRGPLRPMIEELVREFPNRVRVGVGTRAPEVARLARRKHRPRDVIRRRVRRVCRA